VFADLGGFADALRPRPRPRDIRVLPLSNRVSLPEYSALLALLFIELYAIASAPIAGILE